MTRATSDGVLGRWWTRDDPVPARSGWVNVAIGAACAASAALDVRLGLETVGRWYLAYFAVVLLGWGLLAVARGRDPALRRPLRIAGDLLGWAGLVGFALAGLLLDPPEYPALLTLLAFAAAVAAMTVVARRRAPSPSEPPSTR